MQKFCRAMGTLLLGISALIAAIGSASLMGIAVEEIPESIKKNR